MRAKIIPIRIKEREETREQRQREWLSRNEVAVVQRWAWPTGTFLQRRMAKIQAERATPARTVPRELNG